eukprot:366387-Chlamydomonas_euryale.AAC.29
MAETSNPLKSLHAPLLGTGTHAGLAPCWICALLDLRPGGLAPCGAGALLGWRPAGLAHFWGERVASMLGSAVAALQRRRALPGSVDVAVAGT